MCQGDYHPGNLLAQRDGVRVVDWSGFNLGPLESEVAKAFISTLHAPASLALNNELFSKRSDICGRNMRMLRNSGLLDARSLSKRRLLVRMAEFMSRPLPAFYEVL